MAQYQTWAPGIAFMPAERPADGLDNVNGVNWTGMLGLRQSGGTTFQGLAGGHNWFHVPIATPTIVAGTHAKLTKVFLLFQCGNPSATQAGMAGANVTDIHVWDGPNRIHTFGGFQLFGEHRFRFLGPDTSTFFNLPTPIVINFGIEIAVHVNFSQAQKVIFAGAGAEFDI